MDSIGASHGDSHVVDFQVHVGIDDASSHASEVLVLLSSLSILQDGLGAALGNEAGVSAVSIELALTLLTSNFKVLGLDSIEEIVIELLGGSLNVLLIVLVLSILVDNIVNLLAVVVFLIFSVDFPVSLGNITILLGGSLNSVVSKVSLDLGFSGNRGSQDG